MRRFILVIVLFSGFIAAVSAGERLDFNVVQAQTQERVSIYIQGSKARISSSANQQSAVIFDARLRQIHIIDHGDKSVTTLDQASMERLASMAQGVGEFAQSQGGVLGDLFKTFGLDNQLGEQPELEVKTVAGGQKVAGLRCEVQQIYKDGKLDTQLCLTKEAGLAREEGDTLNRLIEFTQLLIREGRMVLEQFKLPIPMLPERALAGVPVYVKNIPSNTTATLAGKKSLTIQAAQFALPAGYSKTVLSL